MRTLKPVDLRCVAWFAFSISALLSACGAGDPGPTAAPPGAVAFVSQVRVAALSAASTGAADTPASGIQPVTAEMTLDWAEYKFPDLFPKASGQRFPDIRYEGVTYNARAYSGAWGVRYLGVTPDGRVFGLGDFTSHVLKAYETLSFWAGQVSADKCGVYPDLCTPSATFAPGQARVAGLQCRGANQTGWCFQHPGEDPDIVTDASFIDATHGWLVSEKGRLLRTLDGGQTWQPLPMLPASGPSARVYFLDRQLGWRLEGSGSPEGRLWRTGDGGQTWTQVPTPLFLVTSLLPVSPQLLVASGLWRATPSSFSTSSSAVSVDGGLNWRLSAEEIGAAERNGALWASGLWTRSNDGGQSFAEEPAVPRARGLFNMHVDATGWGIRIQQEWPQGAFTPTGNRVWGRRGHDAAWVEGVLPAAMQPPQVSFAAPLFYGPMGAWVATCCGTAGSALWRSDDDLRSWRPVTLPRSQLPPPGLATLAPNQFEYGAGFAYGVLDSSAAWVQTASNEASGRGWHITTDGGRTWSANRQPWRGQSNLISEVRQDAGGLLVKQAGGSRWWRSPNHGETWTALPLSQPADADESISQIVFMGPDRGLALSNKGTLLSTDDGGQRWQALGTDTGLPPWVPHPSYGSNLDWPFERGQLLRAQDGALWMQREGNLAKSFDQGRTWRVVNMDLSARSALPASGLPSGVYPWEPRRILWADGSTVVVDVWHRCRNPLQATVGMPPTCDAAVAVSDDGGLSWQVRPSDWDEDTRVAFVSRTRGIRAFCSTVDVTEDGGRTWRAVVGSGAARRYRDNTAVDACERVPQRLLTVGRDADQEIWILFADRSYRSADSGRSWRTAEPSIDPMQDDEAGRGRPRDISFIDGLTGWAVTGTGELASTRDGGRTWTLQPTGFSKGLTAVYAADRDSVWAGGPHNTILATRTGGR